MAFIKEESEEMKIEEAFGVKEEDTEEQTGWFQIKGELGHFILIKMLTTTEMLFIIYSQTREAHRHGPAGDQTRAAVNHPAEDPEPVHEWHEMNWQPKNLPFTENPGPVGDAAALDSIEPKDFIELFISDELIQNIVDQTNLYADQIHAWKPVTVSEMKVFLGLFFLTGIIHKPELDMYWSTDEMLATPYFSKVMSRNRFEIIWRFLHFNDNTARPANDTDRLYKVRPVLDHLVSKFREMYQPNTNICIDEGMPRGRLAFRVYNPQKPIKSYILCDSETGYCFNMKPYCGESAALKDTVVSLLDRLAGHGYRLFMDHFYNSVQLCKHLLDLKTHVCGTIRKNRGEPPVIRDLRNADFRIGETVMCHTENVMVLAWRDKQTVKMVTTCHENKMEEVEVWQRGHQEKIAKQKPACIVEYNNAMNGVDKLDQNIKYYPFVRKSHKWTKKFVTYLLQISLFNAFVIYKAKNPQGNCKTLLSFIQSVINSWTSKEQQHPTRRCRVCARNGLRSETSFYCKSCGVPLHSGNCYTVYHSKIKYSA
uniref:PiggyBac transposable element-derived protein 4-like n=1 Tax=Sinocyclocheilus rhinocerous TaxID=307959 RepID=A0A673MY08_9TELE